MYPNHLNKTIPNKISARGSSLTDSELDKIAVFLVGNRQHFRENIIIPRMMVPVQIKSNEEKQIERIMESCTFKCIMSGIFGMYL